MLIFLMSWWPCIGPLVANELAAFFAVRLSSPFATGSIDPVFPIEATVAILLLRTQKGRSSSPPTIEGLPLVESPLPNELLEAGFDAAPSFFCTLRETNTSPALPPFWIFFFHPLIQYSTPSMLIEPL
jgi:hypothetical protein